MPVSNHYVSYVEHMIRFYITCPDRLTIEGHTNAEVNNWMAVQAVWADLEPEEQRLLTDIYRRKTMVFRDAVKLCATTHNVTEGEAWKLLDRVRKRIARMRGLI